MQRMKQNTTLAAVALVSLTVAFAGCGGGSEASSPPSSNQAAVLGSLSPTSAIAGANSFTLTLNGSNFNSSATALWNGQSVPTTFVNSQQLTATISPSLIASAGFASVIAQNANFGMSNALQFRVNNPAPQIDSLSPDNAMAGAAPVLLTVNGSGFTSEATLLLDGVPRPAYPKSTTQLLTTLSASDLAAARSFTVSVANPEPAVGPSNQPTFTITPFTSNPTPVLISALDSSVPAGWPGFQLTVNGTNFVAASILQWNGIDRVTAVVSSTELKAAIPAGQLLSQAVAQVSVVNPSPGGGASSPLPIQVQAVPPDAIGVIERSDIGDDLSEPDGGSDSAAVSGDGRFVVFHSSASNLIPHDTGSASDVFLRDTCIGAPAGCVPSVTRLPLSGDRPAISANGRFVGVSSGTSVFIHDTCFGAPADCVPAARPINVPADTDKSEVSLSADGRFAAFLSQVSCNYWDYGGCSIQVFFANTCAGVSSGCTSNSQAITPVRDVAPNSLLILTHPTISPDGRFVTFNASDHEVGLYDSCQGGPASCSPSTTMVSVASDGSSSDADSFGGIASLGGRYVAFLSRATNLVPGISVPGVLRIYLRDMCTGASSGCTPTTTSVSVAGDGTFADDPSISADGRYIVFASGATDLVPGDTNGASDIFVRDTCVGVPSGCIPSTVRVSVALDGAQGNSDSGRPVISADGRFVVFISAAKLGPGGRNFLGAEVYLARQ